eukprot:TRINITY_DN5305_c2_g2_i1.p1 TRINITY_DN5305_c2_g2~~TRINITY_DN5305_c2_g2_i1.p1  ORF type:complete len:373 (-),score=75.54 TRINITY_DN5305_c2_g2_i1:14-979(-)
MSCDSNFPCIRCLERSRQCEYGEPKKRGRKKQLKEIDPTSLAKIQVPYCPSAFSSISSLGDSATVLVISGSTSSVEEGHSENESLASPVGSDSSQFDSDPACLRSSDSSDVSPNPVSPETPDIQSLSDILFVPILHGSAGLTWREENRITRIHEKKIKKRIPEYYPHIKSERKRIHELNLSLMNLTEMEEGFSRFYKEVELNIPIFQAVIDQFGCPALIWERCETIFYVNEAFRNLTGISLKPRETYLADEVSDDGLKRYIAGTRQRIQLNKISWNFPCAFVDHNVNAPSPYIHGTLNVTFEHGSVGFGLFNVGVFLPNPI